MPRTCPASGNSASGTTNSSRPSAAPHTRWMCTASGSPDGSRSTTSFLVIHKLLTGLDVEYSESTVRRYIHRHFPKAVRSVMRRETKPGEVMEVAESRFAAPTAGAASHLPPCGLPCRSRRWRPDSADCEAHSGRATACAPRWRMIRLGKSSETADRPRTGPTASAYRLAEARANRGGSQGPRRARIDAVSVDTRLRSAPSAPP